MNKYIRYTLIAVLIVVAVAAAWYASKNGSSPLSASPSPSVSSAETVIPTITYDQTPTDWAKYASMGFELAYPKDWQTGSCGPSCVTFAPSAAADTPLIGLNVTASGSIQQILTSAAPYLKASGSVEFNGLKWTRIVIQEPQTGNVFVSHFAMYGKKIIEFGLGAVDEATVKIYGEMVRSMRPTK
jgi:hypothetical protein